MIGYRTLDGLTNEQLDAFYNDPTVSMCFICHQIEPLNEAYLVCFECGHVFQTAAELVSTYERDMRWMWTGAPDDIPFCPMCLHDF